MTASLKTQIPSWIQSVKSQAQKKTAEMKLPGEEESWRKIDLSGLNISEFKPETASTELTCETKHAHATYFEESEGSPAEPQIKKSLEQGLSSVSDFFSAQNLAYFQRGLHLKASADKETVKIEHSLLSKPAPGNAVLHRVILEVPDSCELTVIEEFSGSPSEHLTLWNCRTEARIGSNAKLNYIQIRYLTDNEYHFTDFTSDQKRDSRVHVSSIHTGGISGKCFITGRVNDPGATFRGIGIGYGAGKEFSDIEMSVEHHASHTESSLHYRTVQKDRSHSVFTGNLYIPKGLVDVHSHQLNNNILLDKKARAQSIPKIIIESESVQCDHGATVGEISEEALLYLTSRGIPEGEARTLLIEGFAVKAIDEIPAPELHEKILEKLKEKLSL